MITNKRIEKYSLVAASQQAVWEKWTSELGIQSFFAAQCKVELAINGAFELYFLPDAPEGQRGSEGCTFISYLPYQMLSFSWNAPPTYPSIRNNAHKTWVVLQFKYIDETKTLVCLSHLGWLKGEEWDKVYAYFDRAWEQVLHNLQQSFSHN